MRGVYMTISALELSTKVIQLSYMLKQKRPKEYALNAVQLICCASGQKKNG